MTRSGRSPRTLFGATSVSGHEITPDDVPDEPAREGSIAPGFTLAGVYEGERGTYSLHDQTAAGTRVLLLFYPADFSPVCTDELCAIRDAEWFSFTDDVTVWAISGDSTYAHRVFSEQYRLNFPLLTDHDGSVADEYGVRYDEWEGNAHVPKRAVFLIDTSREIRYAWHTDDAYIEPEYPPIMEAVERLAEITPTFDEEEIDISVEYTDTSPGNDWSTK